MKGVGQLVGGIGIVPLIAGIYFMATGGEVVSSIVLLAIGLVMVAVGGVLVISRPTSLRPSVPRSPSRGAWR